MTSRKARLLSEFVARGGAKPPGEGRAASARSGRTGTKARKQHGATSPRHLRAPRTPGGAAVEPSTAEAASSPALIRGFRRATYYLAPDQVRALRVIAAEEDRDISAVAREAIADYLRTRGALGMAPAKPRRRGASKTQR